MLCGLNAFVPTMEYYVGKDSKFGWQGIEGFKGMTVKEMGSGGNIFATACSRILRLGREARGSA